MRNQRNSVAYTDAGAFYGTTIGELGVGPPNRTKAGASRACLRLRGLQYREKLQGHFRSMTTTASKRRRLDSRQSYSLSVSLCVWVGVNRFTHCSVVIRHVSLHSPPCKSNDALSRLAIPVSQSNSSYLRWRRCAPTSLSRYSKQVFHAIGRIYIQSLKPFCVIYSFCKQTRNKTHPIHLPAAKYI